jgi:hypothetical protein
MLGKCMTILVRNCLALKAIEVSCSYLSTITGASDPILSRTFETECNLIEFSQRDFIIDVPIFKQAEYLTDYFNSTKLFLSNYVVNPQDSFDAMLNKLFDEEDRAPIVGGVFLNVREPKLGFMKKLMMHQSSEICPKDITKGNCKTAPVIEAMRELGLVGLGSIRIHTAQNSVVVTTFTKPLYSFVRDSPALGKHVSDLGLDLDRYLEILFLTEEREAKIAKERSELKRKTASDNEDDVEIVTGDNLPATKKPHIDSTAVSTSSKTGLPIVLPPNFIPSNFIIKNNLELSNNFSLKQVSLTTIASQSSSMSNDSGFVPDASIGDKSKSTSNESISIDTSDTSSLINTTIDQSVIECSPRSENGPPMLLKIKPEPDDFSSLANVLGIVSNENEVFANLRGELLADKTHKRLDVNANPMAGSSDASRQPLNLDLLVTQTVTVENPMSSSNPGISKPVKKRGPKTASTQVENKPPTDLKTRVKKVLTDAEVLAKKLARATKAALKKANAAAITDPNVNNSSANKCVDTRVLHDMKWDVNSTAPPTSAIPSNLLLKGDF